MQETVLGLAHHPEPEPSDEEVLAMVRQTVDAVGGISAFVRPGDLVLLKPNLTVWFTARDGVTTDPRVVAALVRLCREAGAAHIVVGDSSGGSVHTMRTLEVTGVKRLAEDAGADEVVALEDLPHEEIHVEVEGETHRVRVPRLVLEANCIINVPKAKSHFEDPVTCSLKNWVGLIHQKQRPQFMVDPLLAKLTVALYKRVPAQLTVVDGLWAGEGNGPVALEGVWLGCILAGTDAVIIDRTVARLMGFPPERLIFAAEAERIGVGGGEAITVRVRGPALEDVAIRAKPTLHGFDHLPIRVLVGEGVTWAGSAGHVKSLADLFNKYGFWAKLQALQGPITIMIGAVDDPEFEQRVEAGPYIVVDDAALDRYKRDPRVEFIPGHPATHNIFPHLWHKLRLEHLGPLSMKLESYVKQAEAYFQTPRWSVEEAPQREAR